MSGSFKGDEATIGKLCLEETNKRQSEWDSYQKTRLLCNGSDGEQFNTLGKYHERKLPIIRKPVL